MCWWGTKVHTASAAQEWSSKDLGGQDWGRWWELMVVFSKLGKGRCKGQELQPPEFPTAGCSAGQVLTPQITCLNPGWGLGTDFARLSKQIIYIALFLLTGQTSSKCQHTEEVEKLVYRREKGGRKKKKTKPKLFPQCLRSHVLTTVFPARRFLQSIWKQTTMRKKLQSF